MSGTLVDGVDVVLQDFAGKRPPGTGATDLPFSTSHK